MPSRFFGPRATNLAPDGRVQAFDLRRFLGFQSARLSILTLDGFVHLLREFRGHHT